MMSAFRDRVVSAQQAPPGYWDSDSLHATPQRHHIGTFRRLLRDELMQVADQAAQDDVEDNAENFKRPSIRGAALWRRSCPSLRLTGRCPHRSPRSFNTAQKKALEKEKRDLEKEAQKRIAEEKALTQRRK